MSEDNGFAELAEVVKQQAGVVYAYFRGLVEAGFTEEHALMLTEKGQFAFLDFGGDDDED